MHSFKYGSVFIHNYSKSCCLLDVFDFIYMFTLHYQRFSLHFLMGVPGNSGERGGIMILFIAAVKELRQG